MDCSLNYYRACTNKRQEDCHRNHSRGSRPRHRRGTIQLSFPHLHNSSNININVLINKKGKSNGHNDVELTAFAGLLKLNYYSIK